jgi:hypothetical protein
MSTTSAIIFGVAFVFYLCSWTYIRQLVREVKATQTGNSVSIWRWHKGWKRHRELFPTGSVRLRIIACIALTVGLGLVAFGIEARSIFTRR